MLPTNTVPAMQATLPHEAAALFYEWWNFYAEKPDNQQAFFGVCEIIRQALGLEANYFQGVVMVTLDTNLNAMTPTVTLHVDAEQARLAQEQAQQSQLGYSAPVQVPQTPHQPQAPVHVPQQPQMNAQNFGTGQAPVNQYAQQTQSQQPAQQHPGQFVQQMPPDSHTAPVHQSYQQPGQQPHQPVTETGAPVPQLMAPGSPLTPQQAVHVPASESRPVGGGAHTEMGLGNVQLERGPANETIPVSGIRGQSMGVSPRGGA